MEKIDFGRKFADRLKEAMQAAGFNSARSTSGVCIHKLVEITGYSTQICRKYLKGEALPDPVKLSEIAACLKVSPGWLLFGDGQADNPAAQDSVRIQKKVLQHIFTRARSLYQTVAEDASIAQFLMELIDDLSQINASEEQSLKIIELAFTSAHHFSH